MRILLKLTVFLLILASPGEASEDLRLSVRLEAPADPPHVQEMIIAVIEGHYRIPITLEKLEQPAFADFGWMQLGEDRWSDAIEEGLRVVKFERRMAIYPEISGLLEIGSFHHHLTLSRPNGERYEQTVTSEPVTINVAKVPDDESWWFPVTKIYIDDSWSNASQRLGPLDSALRKVTIEVQGTQPELIPPMPDLTGTGLVILPHPEQRITVLRHNGPITRAFWRWTIRPDGQATGYTDPLDIDYFDSSTREAKKITLSVQKIAYENALADSVREDAEAASSREEPQLALPSIIKFVPAFFGLLGCAIVLFFSRMHLSIRNFSRPLWLQPAYWRLRTAMMKNNTIELRKAMYDLQKVAGDFTSPEAKTRSAALLANLDRRLFSEVDPGSPTAAQIGNDFLKSRRLTA